MTPEEIYTIMRVSEDGAILADNEKDMKKALAGLDRYYAQTIEKAKEDAVRGFVEEIMEIPAGENLGMGSLDYHEKCAIDGFKEYVKFGFLERVGKVNNLSQQGGEQEQGKQV